MSCNGLHLKVLHFLFGADKTSESDGDFCVWFIRRNIPFQSSSGPDTTRKKES